MQPRHNRFHPHLVKTDIEDDRVCLSAIANGDRAAFDRLYRRYYQRLFRFGLRVTGRMHLVEDVINETMIVVWRRAGDYRAAASVSTWVFGIAFRKSLRALAHDGRGLTAFENMPQIDFASPAITERDDMQATVRQAITALSAEQRAIIELTFRSGYSYQEIAQILDCPVGTVKSRMFHARAKLRPLLTRLLGDPP